MDEKIIIYDVFPAIELVNQDILAMFQCNEMDKGKSVDISELPEEKQGSTCICYEIKSGEYRGKILKEFCPKDEEFFSPNPKIERNCPIDGSIGKYEFVGKSSNLKYKYNQYYKRFINQAKSMAYVQQLYNYKSLFDALDLQIANTSIGICYISKKLKDINDYLSPLVEKDKKKTVLCDILSKAFRQLQEIKRIHDVGYACLDVKPSNFCYIEIEEKELSGIRLVDYGSALSKEMFTAYVDNDVNVGFSSSNIVTSNSLYYIREDLDHIVAKAGDDAFDFRMLQALDIKAIGIYILSELSSAFDMADHLDIENTYTNRYNIIKDVITCLDDSAQNYELLDTYFAFKDAIEYLLDFKIKPTCDKTMEKLTTLFSKIGAKPDFIFGNLDDIYKEEGQKSNALKFSFQQFDHPETKDLYGKSDKKTILMIINESEDNGLRCMRSYLSHKIFKADI